MPILIAYHALSNTQAVDEVTRSRVRRAAVDLRYSLRVTIRDVAALAGVSVSTVSYVLNANPLIQPSTRQRVEAAIQALGYRPNSTARNLHYSYIQNVWQPALYAGSAQNLGYADMETLGSPATAEWAILPIAGGTPTATATPTIGTPAATATPTSGSPTSTPSPTATPPATSTPIWLLNRGNGKYVTYDPTTNVARFTASPSPSDQNAQWRLIPFNGKLHICSVTNTEPYGPGQDTACWPEQAWTDTVQPTPPAGPTPGPDGHLPYIRVGSTYDGWSSNQFSLIDQHDGYVQIKVTGWYNDLADSSLGYGYADVTYTPSAPANAEWQVVPVGGASSGTTTATNTPASTSTPTSGSPTSTLTSTSTPSGPASTSTPTP